MPVSITGGFATLPLRLQRQSVGSDEYAHSAHRGDGQDNIVFSGDGLKQPRAVELICIVEGATQTDMLTQLNQLESVASSATELKIELGSETYTWSLDGAGRVRVTRYHGARHAEVRISLNPTEPRARDSLSNPVTLPL